MSEKELRVFAIEVSKARERFKEAAQYAEKDTK